jgi:hypothetical protein
METAEAGRRVPFCCWFSVVKERFQGGALGAPCLLPSRGFGGYGFGNLPGFFGFYAKVIIFQFFPPLRSLPFLFACLGCLRPASLEGVLERGTASGVSVGKRDGCSPFQITEPLIRAKQCSVPGFYGKRQMVRKTGLCCLYSSTVWRYGLGFERKK